MRAALVHRGPDEGSTDAFGHCVLGHQRLKVIDLETGYQPVSNERGDVVAVFNGELYNFQALREELERATRSAAPATRRSCRTSTRSTAPRFVERLDGMFALALWDAGARAARARPRPARQEAAPLDAAARRHARVRLGAEGAAAAARRLARARPRRALDAYLALQYVPGNGTALRGIHKLPPGHVLVVEGGTVADRARTGGSSPRNRARTKANGSSACGQTVRRGRAQAARRGRAARRAPLRRDRLEHRRRADGAGIGAAGAHVHGRLSGRALRRARVRARGRRAVRHACTRRCEIEPDVASTLLPRLAAAFDEPLGDEAALPTFLISEQARQHVTVALAGDGGDEVVRRLRALRRASRWRQRVAGAAAPARRSGAALLPAGQTGAALAARPRGALPRRRGAPAGERYGRLMEVFPVELRARALGPRFADSACTESGASRPDRGDRGPAAPRRRDLPAGRPALKADIASMAHSLELRSPFLDHEVARARRSRCPTR